jgi:hypothetical protein
VVREKQLDTNSYNPGPQERRSELHLEEMVLFMMLFPVKVLLGHSFKTIGTSSEDR